MKKYSNILIILTGIVLLSYLAGPRVKYEVPVFFDTELGADVSELESYIQLKESEIVDMKPDNEARIIWNDDSLKNVTEYSVVYLHGFSASQEEGDPVHIEFARRYGFNLYLSRLDDHGRSDPDSFKDMTPDSYIQSAEEAIEIGRKIGKKVIVMACSSGATLAAILASEGADIHSLIFYSPNIDIADSNSNLLLFPWGKQMASLVMGGTQNHVKYDSLAANYWNSTYHTNGLFVLKTIIRDYMKKDVFENIEIPVFIGYYYENEELQDNVVSVKRMLDFYDQLGTPENQKRKVAFPKAGRHVICSHVFSKDIEGVKNETFRFAQEVLKFIPSEGEL
ncbi:MAG: alpha/beta hydrolase [Saprospiraceae bacterium]|nr:alpha/beta hydrolase [Saprospiraceae bacterium]